MLSLDTANKLKEAGLPWELKEGDFVYYHTYGKEEVALGVISDSDMGERKEESLDNIYTGEWIIAPRLDQLLAEIEGRGYIWKLRNRSDNHYFIELLRHNGKGFVQCYHEETDSPDEAAAAARIWILEQEKGAKE